MQRVFLTGLSVVIILSTALGVILVISLLPHVSIIGIVATGVAITGLVCIGLLMVAFTITKMGKWFAGLYNAILGARMLVSGEMATYVNPDKTFEHLSAEHWKAKAPLMLPAPQEEDEHSQLDTRDPRLQKILDAHKWGESNRQIAIALGVDRRKVAQVLEEWGHKGCTHGGTNL